MKSPKQEKGHKRDALSGVQLKECLQGMSRNDKQGLRDRAMFMLMAVCSLRFKDNRSIASRRRRSAEHTGYKLSVHTGQGA